MWHALSVEKIFEMLNSSAEGLSKEEVKRRQKIYGKNRIVIKRKSLFLQVLEHQLKNYFLWLLIFAVLLSFYIGEIKEAILIAFVIFAYLFLDFLQQYRSDKIISLLKKETEYDVIVRREGIEDIVKASELVPGDIVILKQGNKVPADIRIIQARNLQVDESSLTGESKPVIKENTVLPEDTPLAERKNMLFMGTYILKGYCEGIVVATGNSTVLGKIYKKVEEIEEKQTPLEIELNKFSKFVTIITSVIILITFFFVLTLGYLTIYDAILFAIALGVAVIPEGLPAVLTVVYTIGLHKIYKKGAIVKRLDTVETLGSVDTIFTDKTGTLTMNKFTVRKFWYNDKIYEVTGEGYEPTGSIFFKDNPINLSEIDIFIEACLNSVDTEIVYENGWKIIGDPLEAALIILAYKAGLKRKLEKIYVFDFDQVRKRMSIINKKGDKYIAYIKGAPEKILEISKYILINGELENIEKYKKKIIDICENFAKEGYRVLAIGYKEVGENKIYDLDEVEKDIVFLGIVVMEDPIRQDVIEAVDFANKAGIDVVIITGDHPETAKAVAKKLGIETEYILSSDIKKMSDEKIYEALKTVKIIARADPEDKHRVVRIFKEKDHYVAMTGDGINDSVALREADIGISLADATDIAKEAADMIMLNNSFSSIIEAIKEGRRIFYSLKVFLIIALSINIGLLTGILLFFTFLKDVILKAIHILIINLAIEGVNAIIVGSGSVSEKLLYTKPPRKIVNKKFVLGIIRNGIILGILAYILIILSNSKSPFILILFFAATQYILFIYYQIKFGIKFTDSKYFYLGVLISLLIILTLSVPPLNQYTELSISDIRDILLVLISSFAFLIIKLALYKGQPVPELHHTSANSDHHHNK